MNPLSIIALVDTAVQLTGSISAIVREAKRNRELTPDQERELDEKIAQLRSSDHWQERP